MKKKEKKLTAKDIIPYYDLSEIMDGIKDCLFALENRVNTHLEWHKENNNTVTIVKDSDFSWKPNMKWKWAEPNDRGASGAPGYTHIEPEQKWCECDFPKGAIDDFKNYYCEKCHKRIKTIPTKQECACEKPIPGLCGHNDKPWCFTCGKSIPTKDEWYCPHCTSVIYDASQNDIDEHMKIKGHTTPPTNTKEEVKKDWYVFKNTVLGRHSVHWNYSKKETIEKLDEFILALLVK
jgi:hypothetical protein